MSDLLKEAVIPMPAISMRALEQFGEKILEELDPEHLKRPRQLDLLQWVDEVLPQYGIEVAPVPDEQLGDCYAITLPDGNADIDILVASSLWHQLIAGGRRANLARSTIAHEIAHAVLHVPVLRRRRDTPQLAMVGLKRERRENIKPFRDPEWQAFALGTAILAPRRTIVMLPKITVGTVADTYGISEALAEKHLKRLKLPEAAM